MIPTVISYLPTKVKIHIMYDKLHIKIENGVVLVAQKSEV